MRILHVISTVDPSHGGPSEAMMQRGRVLESMGHRVEVLTADPPDAPFLSDYLLRVHGVGPGKGGMAYAPQLKSWLEEHATDYDAVIASGIWQYSTLAVGAVMKRLRRPYWVFTHGMLDPYFNRQFPLKALKKWAYWPLLYPVLRDAAAVLFTCEEEKLLARQAFRPYKVREYVVKYGTRGPEADAEVQANLFLRHYALLEGKPQLLFLSRINPKKGVDLLIQAFHEESGCSPNLQLVLAGPVEADYRQVLEALIEKGAAADRIHWTGMLNGDTKWGAFRSAKAFILPSHQENFGIAVVEALACGLPVLITDRVNIWREIVADGAGLVQPDTLEGVKQLLRNWLRTSEEEQSEMSRRALDCFSSRFTVAHSAESLLEAIADTGPSSTKRAPV